MMYRTGRWTSLARYQLTYYIPNVEWSIWDIWVARDRTTSILLSLCLCYRSFAVIYSLIIQCVQLLRQAIDGSNQPTCPAVLQQHTTIKNTVTRGQTSYNSTITPHLPFVIQSLIYLFLNFTDRIAHWVIVILSPFLNE